MNVPISINEICNFDPEIEIILTEIVIEAGFKGYTIQCMKETDVKEPFFRIKFAPPRRDKESSWIFIFYGINRMMYQVSLTHNARTTWKTHEGSISILKYWKYILSNENPWEVKIGGQNRKDHL